MTINKYSSKSNHSDDTVYITFSLSSFDLCGTPKPLYHGSWTLSLYAPHISSSEISDSLHFVWLRWPAFCDAPFVGVRCWGTCCTRMKTSCSSIVTRTQEEMLGSILPPNIPGGRCSGVVKFSSHFPPILFACTPWSFSTLTTEIWKNHLSSESLALCCIVCFYLRRGWNCMYVTINHCEYMYIYIYTIYIYIYTHVPFNRRLNHLKWVWILTFSVHAKPWMSCYPSFSMMPTWQFC